MEAQNLNPVHLNRYPFLEAQGPGFDTWRLLKDPDQKEIYYNEGMLSEKEYHILMKRYNEKRFRKLKVEKEEQYLTYLDKKNGEKEIKRKSKRCRKSIGQYVPGYIDSWAYNPNDTYHRSMIGQLTVEHTYESPIEDPGFRLMEIHKRYLDDITSKKIILFHPNKGYIAYDYVVRGTKRYEKRQKGKCVNIINNWSNTVKCQGTAVRISPRHTGSRTILFEKLNKDKPRILNYIRNYKVPVLGLNGEPRKDKFGKLIYEYPFRGVKYLWSIEPTERHYIHIHIVFGMMVNKGLFADIILKWFQNQGYDIESPGVKVEDVRSEGSLKGYIMKYVTKTCRDKFWNGLLWITGKRSWGSSKGLAKAPLGAYRLTQNDLDEDPIEKWVYIGVMDDIMVDYVLKENPPPDELRLEQWFSKNIDRISWGFA